MSQGLLLSGTPEKVSPATGVLLGDRAHAADPVRQWVLHVWSFSGPFGKRVTLLFLLNYYFFNFYISE